MFGDKFKETIDLQVISAWEYSASSGMFFAKYCRTGSVCSFKELSTKRKCSELK
jgi:hypothetical protein